MLMGSPSAGLTGPGPAPMLQPETLYEAFKGNFDVVLAETPALVDEVFALRYQVYCLEREYEERSSNPTGRETDSYDGRSVHALVRHRRTGVCAATVRLVLADHNQPLASFPAEAVCGDDGFFPGVTDHIKGFPRTQIAEISRFAVSKEFRRRYDEAKYTTGLSPNVPYFDMESRTASENRRVMPQITIGLFNAIVALSMIHGVTHWFAVMEPTLLRLLQRFGIEFPPIGPLVEHHGTRQPTFAPAGQVVAGILAKRPDVWEIVTDQGRRVP